MNIEEKLVFLKNCIEEPPSQFTHINSNNSDILKSCFYHIHELNQSISQQHTHTIEQKDIGRILPPNFAKINRKIRQSEEEFTAKSLLNRGRFLLTTLPIAQKNSMINSSKSLIDPLSQTVKPLKQNRVKPKIYFRKGKTGLSKQQRYFEAQPVSVPVQTVDRIGLYESGNMFKTKNIMQSMKNLTIIAQKPQLNPIRLANKNDLFLTNITAGNADFCVQTFIEEQLGRDRQCEQVIAQCDSIRTSKQYNLADINSILSDDVPPIQPTQLYITFQDYKVLEDQNYKLFKIKHMQIWSTILFNITLIKKCLQNSKILHIGVRQDKLTFWEGVKITQSHIKQLLGIDRATKSAERVNRIVLAFRDRLKVAVMKRAIQRRQSLARWVVQRFKTIINLRKVKEQKISKAMKMHRQLKQSLDWQVQIHIPSFSVQAFKRNTTQYMQSFQAQYHTLWQSTQIALILVLPALNENILKLLQTRIRITRNVTIITPEVHELFPANLPLAAQVLFSYETLAKIQKAVGGRRAVIVNGMCEDPHYELMLSQHLSVPVFGSLVVKNNSEEQKNFFVRAGLKTTKYCAIQPRSTMEGLLGSLAELLLESVEDKCWIFKIKGQFRGRGIATLQFNSGKYMNANVTADRNKQVLIQNLRSTLRLKLKVNFQNSLYMVQDYLQRFRLTGGIIQQYIQTSATYELCFKKLDRCELISLFKVYGINFANKIWLSTSEQPALTLTIDSLIAQIDAGDYLGHISVTICRAVKGEYFGIDIKLNQTPASSITPFLMMLQQKRSLAQTNIEAINIAALPTKRTDRLTNRTARTIINSRCRFLFIPAFPFTDVQQTAKSKFIQELMRECWGDRHLRLGEQGRLYLSLGLDFAGLVMSRQVKRVKKLGIQLVRQLTERTSSMKEYRGKQMVRDVFQYGDVIRAISQIRNDD